MHPKKQVVEKSQSIKNQFVSSQNELINMKKNKSWDNPKPQNSGQTEIKEIKEGSSVIHDRFGNGKVISIDGEGSDKRALIEFKGMGKKNLILRFAKLKIKK